jgi:hypothetical protein
MVEFIGILSQEPSLAYQHDEHSDSSYGGFVQINEKLLNSNSESDNQQQQQHQQMDVEDDSINHQLNKCTACKCDNKAKTFSSFPPSLVPRLHCIKSHHLFHNNPFLNRERLTDWHGDSDSFDEKKVTKEEKERADSDLTEQKALIYWKQQYYMFLNNLLNESNQNEIKMSALKLSPSIDVSLLYDNSKIYLHKLRQEIVDCFQEMLLGDALAAEYLLMHLLSSV